MYEIIIYQDKNGKSQILDFLYELVNKNGKDAKNRDRSSQKRISRLSWKEQKRWKNLKHGKKFVLIFFRLKR